MGSLENLVANTAYLKAQAGDSPELRKRRCSLNLPKPQRRSSATREAMCKLGYESLCEAQPIGKRLFRQFLMQNPNPEYAAAAEFLAELSAWALAESGADKEAARRNILTKFCEVDSESYLGFLAPGVAERCKAASDRDFEEVMVSMVREATTDFLRRTPFSEYQKSSSFDRFLQWKEYEKQQVVNDRYFYEFRTLGKGAFGEVSAVQVKHTGQMYACKKLNKKKLRKKCSERMALSEKQILEKVNSLFVVGLAYAYQNATHLCLVMNLMNGGDLKFHIYELGPVRGLRMERVVHYTAQMVTGLLHLHAMDVVYRDMKPENVLLDARGQCRLSDLGLAVSQLEGDHSNSVRQKAGTHGYMAPEILRQECYWTSVDWWALGCSIYEMVAARLPFKDFREKVLLEELTRRTLEDDCRFEHRNFDVPTKHLVSLFLRRRLDGRLGCRGEDPRKHAFFRNVNLARLEAGLLEAPWLPSSTVVYTKDTEEFRDSSHEAKDVRLDAKDEKFFKVFSTGLVSIPWQHEVIDSGLFDELNNPQRAGSVCVDGDGVGISSTSCRIL